MTIAHRLYAFILVVVIGLTTLATVGMTQMAKVYDGANYANVNTVPSMLTLDASFEAVSQLRVKIWQYLSLTA